MRNILQIFAVLFILSGVSIATWYAGGVVLVITFAVIGLVSVILVAFALGSHWTFTTMKAGADLAIASSNTNDRNDAIKTQALAALVREAVKQFKTELPAPTMQLPSGFPPTQPLLGSGPYPEGEHRKSLASPIFGKTSALDSRTFIIQGLEDEACTEQSRSNSVAADNGHQNRDDLD
jgi:hypothetical protein